MDTNSWQNKYYTGDDLLNKNKKILFQRISEELEKEKGVIASVFSQKKKNDEKLEKCRKKIEELQVQQAPETQVNRRKNMYKTIDRTQSLIIQTLQPKFNELFDVISADITIGGREYNEILRTHVWHDIIFGERQLSWPMDLARQNYRNDFISSFQKAEKKQIKKPAKKPRKIYVARNHHILNPETYPENKEQLFLSLQSVTDKYMKVFEIDQNHLQALQHFLNKYFSYLLIQTLFETKCVLECKSTRWNAFVVQLIVDVQDYFQKKYNISITHDPIFLKKKLFNNLKSDDIGPIEISYKNSNLDDIEQWEEYFNVYYFYPRSKTINIVRGEIMQEFIEWMSALEESFKFWNPEYHYYKEKVEWILRRLAAIEPWEKQEVLPMLPPILKDLAKFKQEKKDNETIIEKDPIHNPDAAITLTEVQGKYMRMYNIPVQFHPLFAITVHKNNHYHKIKAGAIRRADWYNEILKNIFFYKWAPERNTLDHLLAIITNRDIENSLEQKRKETWAKRREEIRGKIHLNYKKNQQTIAYKLSKKPMPPDRSQYEIPFEAENI